MSRLTVFWCQNTVNQLRFWYRQMKKANNWRKLTWIKKSFLCKKATSVLPDNVVKCKSGVEWCGKWWPGKYGNADWEKYLSTLVQKEQTDQDKLSDQGYTSLPKLWSVLGSFGVFQGKNWSVAPFIPEGPSENQNSCIELAKIKHCQRHNGPRNWLRNLD